MISLETSRLILRNFCSEDAAPLLEYALQYRASSMGVYDYPWPAELEKIQKIVADFSSTDSYIAVCLKETGAFVGFVDLMRSETHGSLEFELGYGFNFNYHGQGYASEACTALVRYAFENLLAQRLTSGTAQANVASQRVLEKLGFVKIGEERVSFQVDANGKPIVFTGYLYELTREHSHFKDR